MAITTHHLTITLPVVRSASERRRQSKHARAQVTYLQPKAERWRERTATVHITCGEWIEPYWHPAIYVAGNQMTSGKFMPTSYKLGEAHGWTYEGVFEREE